MQLTNSDVIKAVIDAEILPESEASLLKEGVKLDEQGVDSLAFYNLLLVLEERCGIHIPDNEVNQLHTMKDIIDYFNSKMAG